MVTDYILGVSINLVDGEVDFGACTCEARADQRCAHVACLLYMIEDLSLDQEPKIQQPGTSQQQAWGKGKRTELDPAPVFEKTYSKKREQDRYVNFVIVKKIICTNVGISKLIKIFDKSVMY